MSQLSPRARRLVESARKEAAPTAEELQHLRARLMAGLSSQAPDPVLLPFSLTRLAGLLAVAAVGVGGWYLRGAFAADALPVTPVAAPAPAACVAAPPGAPPTACSCPLVAAPEPVPEKATTPIRAKPVACPPAPDDVGALDPERAGPRPMQHDLFSVARAQDDASLELQLLILAREALDDGRPIVALGHAQRHEALYPDSAFTEERLAIEVLANCAGGYPDRATQRIEQLLSLSADSTYLPRIRGTCGEELIRAAREPERGP